MKNEVEEILNEVRPSLRADGGDVELIDIDEKNGIIKLKLQGACSCCPMSALTLKEGIGRVLKARLDWVKEIEQVN